jgi:hypothetical protein
MLWLHRKIADADHEAGTSMISAITTLPMVFLEWLAARDAIFSVDAGLEDLEYSELQLVPVHEHVILGTSQFWDCIAPDDAVLRSHLYLKV